MSSLTSKGNAEYMLDVVQKFLEAGGQEPIDLGELAEFAIDGGHWNQGGYTTFSESYANRRFSRAFREQYHTDAQGRNVRTFYPKIKNVYGR